MHPGALPGVAGGLRVEGEVTNVSRSARGHLYFSLKDADAARRDREAAADQRQAVLNEARREASEIVQRAQKVADETREKGVADYRIVDSQGATEGTVANETAEAIADITSSGETLRANHLKVLSDGPILRSQATLWRSRTAEMSESERAIAAHFASLVNA